MIQRQATRSRAGESHAELPDTEIHDVLRNDRRRMLLEALGDVDGSTTLRSLSETIAAMEADADPPPRNVRESVYIALHQTHLPKLDDLDVVDYDNNTKEVSPGANAAVVGVYMDARPVPEPRFDEYGVPLMALTAVLAATTLGVPGLDRVSTATWTALAFAAVTLTLGYKAYRFRGSLVHRLEQ